MRDYDNMPKIDWHDDKATLARIKAQINLQEPVIIRFPDNFNLTVDTMACGCETKADMLLRCQPQTLFATLAERNDLPVLNELGKLAHDRGQVVDIDPAKQSLVVYD